eukprot:TRINITY_DN535_c0_g1_i1.p1 TRINITY_DN535_c0_g1~~TRINITY_DN535_c0_g1_i1.p1  ORF type:complete len:453 (-),score=117.12 TRINITY_DN535_c0_g1_i1:115-1473(-)
MGLIISCLASTAASCCIGLSCSLCGKACSCSSSPTARSNSTRAAYVILFLVVSVVSFLFSNWAFDWLSKIPYIPATFHSCPPDSTCYGALAVYRITFGLAVFHLIQAIFMIGVKDTGDARANLQDGWFPLKLLFLVGLTAAAFWIPNSFFVVYGWTAVFGAGAFIIIQLLLLIEFAYTWNETWVRNMEDEQTEGHNGKKWFWGLLIATFIMIAGALSLTIVMYKFFCTGEGCGLNTMFVTVNLIATVFLCLLSLHPAVRRARPSSGLLQSSMIMIYTTYLVWSAIMSEPTTQCNPFAFNDNTNEDHAKGFNVSLMLGAFFTIVSVCYSTFRASGSSGQLGIGEQDAEAARLVDDTDDDKEEGGRKRDEPEEIVPVKYNYSFFHLTFALGAMYICMLLTNWMTISHDDADHSVNVDTGMVSVWVKMVSGWLTIGLYIWTLVAPILLPNREWSN